MSSKSVKRLRRYGDLTVFFEMATVRHLGFVGRVLGPPTNLDCFVVFIVEQNLVGIAAVLSTIRMF